MPLVQYYKRARIQKRSKRLKGRPAWQDALPPSKQGRDAYAIAAKYQSTFAKTFLGAMRELITPDVEKQFREAWRTGSPAQIIESIPYYEPFTEEPVWEQLLQRLDTAYASVIQAAGDDATSELNGKFGTDMSFAVLPPKSQAEEIVNKSMDDVRQAAAGMTVGVNPYSAKWIRDRGMELVTQSITVQQRKVVNDVILSAFERGGRPTETLSAIKENIGLTHRDYNATVKRRQLHLDSGMSTTQADALTAKYRDKLLTGRATMIARTETITAQARGRRDAWQVAQDSGDLPAVQRRWMSAPPSPNPNRPCEICLELDGKTAQLNEPYESLYIGPVDGPTAHVGCRCTETIERKG